jgi:hypothetical protein
MCRQSMLPMIVWCAYRLTVAEFEWKQGGEQEQQAT